MSSAQVKKSEKVADKKVKGAAKEAVKAAPVEVAVATPVEKKQRAKKVKDVAPAEKKEESKPAADEEKKEYVKKTPATSESVQTDLSELIENLSKSKLGEVSDLKQALKTLRQSVSRLKNLRNDLTRVLKKTNRAHAPKDKSKLSNSGLMKPVAISKDLAHFMGVSTDSLHSRVSVTNAICNYIKEKNLQNPSNKRQISPDANLAKILGYKSDNAQPLTYFYIQQLIQPHFLKEVSSDMSKFLAVPEHSMLSTTAVVAGVSAWASKKNLVHDGVLSLDETLSKLLNKSGSVPLASLNQLVKAHFKK